MSYRVLTRASLMLGKVTKKRRDLCEDPPL